MSARPETLWPLFSKLDALPGVGPKSAALFSRIDVETPRDLLLTPPFRLVDRRLVSTVAEVPEGEIASVEIVVEAHHPPRAKGRPYRIAVRDSGCAFLLIFFHADADRLRRLAPVGARRIVSGRIEIFDHVRQMPHPDHLLPPEQAAALPEFEPVYPSTKGLSQRVLAKAVAGALERAPALPEWIEPSVIARRRWPSWQTAVRALHAPRGEADMAPGAPARARLAYDELLSHQLALGLARAMARRGKGRPTIGDGRLRAAALAALPYAPTGAQSRAVAEIEADMAAPERMRRLLQGDVGSGKTLVALLAMLIAVEAGGQAALMAPTELLARQHAESLAPLADAAGVRLVLLTGRDKGAARAEKIAALESGEAAIAIGTHALFQSDVAFRDLRLAIVDEQHRFGVRQRLVLGEKGAGADTLVMTATPIPRTLALAGYGDMDFSALDEKPPGRRPVETRLVSLGRIDEVVARLGAAMADGARVYWVCPLVTESETSELTAAEARYAALRSAFGAQVRLVHGQMPPAERDAAMADFQSARATLLVATSVIEVGVNVPEATIMVVERAESFGLAQLHQLRGRVGRGDAASTCLLVYAPPLGDAARARLEILRETEDGFRIAEEDLRIRGHGDLLGAQQSGLPRFRIADLAEHGELMALARDDARLALTQEPDLAGARGDALRLLLWLHSRDEAIRLMRNA
jgi:ATP-dependent DNA helicase RecG